MEKSGSLQEHPLRFTSFILQGPGPPAFTDSDDKETVSSGIPSGRLNDGNGTQAYDLSWMCLDEQVAWIKGDQPSIQRTPEINDTPGVKDKEQTPPRSPAQCQQRPYYS